MKSLVPLSSRHSKGICPASIIVRNPSLPTKPLPLPPCARFSVPIVSSLMYVKVMLPRIRWGCPECDAITPSTNFRNALKHINARHRDIPGCAPKNCGQRRDCDPELPCELGCTSRPSPSPPRAAAAATTAASAASSVVDQGPPNKRGSNKRKIERVDDDQHQQHKSDSKSGERSGDEETEELKEFGRKLVGTLHHAAAMVICLCVCVSVCVCLFAGVCVEKIVGGEWR